MKLIILFNVVLLIAGALLGNGILIAFAISGLFFAASDVVARLNRPVTV